MAEVDYYVGIDPGPRSHGVVVVKSDYSTIEGVDLSTDMLCEKLERLSVVCKTEVSCEWIQSYGMKVGKEVFETVFQIGRIYHAHPMRLIPRLDVKLHICGQARAKDANIRQALIDRFGAPGTKKNPGRTYGMRAHLWQALAVAVTAREIPKTDHEWSPK